MSILSASLGGDCHCFDSILHHPSGTMVNHVPFSSDDLQGASRHVAVRRID